jgi:hypothetical protein
MLGSLVHAFWIEVGANPTVTDGQGSQQIPQNCIHANRDSPLLLRHIIKNISETQRRAIYSRDPPVTVIEVCF